MRAAPPSFQFSQARNELTLGWAAPRLRPSTVQRRPPQPWTAPPPAPQLVSAVAKAIQNSPLSLAPAVEGSEVLVKLPRMTKDTIEQVGPAPSE